MYIKTIITFPSSPHPLPPPSPRSSNSYTPFNLLKKKHESRSVAASRYDGTTYNTLFRCFPCKSLSAMSQSTVSNLRLSTICHNSRSLSAPLPPPVAVRFKQTTCSQRTQGYPHCQGEYTRSLCRAAYFDFPLRDPGCTGRQRHFRGRKSADLCGSPCATPYRPHSVKAGYRASDRMDAIRIARP